MERAAVRSRQSPRNKRISIQLHRIHCDRSLAVDCWCHDATASATTHFSLSLSLSLSLILSLSGGQSILSRSSTHWPLRRLIQFRTSVIYDIFNQIAFLKIPSEEQQSRGTESIGKSRSDSFPPTFQQTKR